MKKSKSRIRDLFQIKTGKEIQIWNSALIVSNHCRPIVWWGHESTHARCLSCFVYFSAACEGGHMYVTAPWGTVINIYFNRFLTFNWNSTRVQANYEHNCENLVFMRQQVRLAWNKALYSYSTYINKACCHVVTLTVSRDDVEAKTKRCTDGVSSWTAAAGLSVHYLTSFNPRVISGEVKGQTGHAPSTGCSPKQAGETQETENKLLFSNLHAQKEMERGKKTWEPHGNTSE